MEPDRQATDVEGDPRAEQAALEVEAHAVFSFGTSQRLDLQEGH
jgi:hypothetical protein